MRTARPPSCLAPLPPPLRGYAVKLVGSKQGASQPVRAHPRIRTPASFRTHIFIVLSHKCHLCGWIQRIPEGTRQHDGLETGSMVGEGGRDIGVQERTSFTDSYSVSAFDLLASALLHHTLRP